MRRTVELRSLAADDIAQATDHYLGTGGAEVALKFVDAVEHAVKRIGRAPLTGSLRFAYEVGIPDLRVCPVGRFPYLLFYVAEADRVYAWRVLHQRRDFPAAMVEDSDSA